MEAPRPLSGLPSSPPWKTIISQPTSTPRPTSDPSQSRQRTKKGRGTKKTRHDIIYTDAFNVAFRILIRPRGFIFLPGRRVAV